MPATTLIEDLLPYPAKIKADPTFLRTRGTHCAVLVGSRAGFYSLADVGGIVARLAQDGHEVRVLPPMET